MRSRRFSVREDAAVSSAGGLLLVSRGMQSANLALEGARRNLEASTTAGAQIAPVTSADEVQKQICDRETKGNIS